MENKSESLSPTVGAEEDNPVNAEKGTVVPSVVIPKDSSDDRVLARLVALLEVDQFGLRKFWNEHFPEAELEAFANNHGYSFD